MVKHGTWLVADIYNDDYLLGKRREFQLPEESIDKEKTLGQLQRDNFAKAVKAGVKIAFGTDAGVYPHGDNAKQFAYMVKYGLTPAQAIRSATVRRRRTARPGEGRRPRSRRAITPTSSPSPPTRSTTSGRSRRSAS